MKTFLFALYMCASLWGAAQTVDSVALRQVDSLILAAQSYDNNGEIDKALETLAVAEKLALSPDAGMGPESASYAACCNMRGLIGMSQYNYAECEKWFLKAVSIREKTLGKNNIRYCGSVINLAIIYTQLGQYRKAEPLYLEAKEIFETRLNNRTHSYYVNCLTSLADIYSEMHRYEPAETLYAEVKAICEKTVGTEHPVYIRTLFKMGGLARKLGQYKKAEQLLLESKTKFEKNVGKENGYYPLITIALGTVYLQMGQYEKAESFFLESKSIQEKVVGTENVNYALNLECLGALYGEIGQYEKAESLLLEQKAIAEKVGMKEDPAFALTLCNLARIYMEMGRYEKAESLCLEAKSNMERLLGNEDPYYALIMNTLTALYSRMRYNEKAEPQFLELSVNNRAVIQKSVHHLSERELNNYLVSISEAQYRTLSFVQMDGSKKLAGVCYDDCLFYKGFLLQAVGGIRQLALRDANATEKLNRLKDLQSSLAEFYSRRMSEPDRSSMTQLEDQANDLEKDIARTVVGYADVMRQVQWQEVQSALKPGEAAIEFVRYRYLVENNVDSTMYAALVLRPTPDGPGSPQFITLFEENDLAAILQRQDTEKQTEYINALYRNPALYGLLWKPLEQSLAGVKTVYFSPDGLLHRLNIHAVPTPDGQILTDRYRLIRLNSTRQLVIPAPTKPAANDALVYGGIQYDMNTEAIQKANAVFPQSKPGGTRGELDFQQTDSTQRISYRGFEATVNGAWQYLPFTEVEALLVQHDLQAAGTSVRLMNGYSATEESFKSLGGGHTSPRILHLATHGYFFPDPKSQESPSGSRLGETGFVFKMSEHPMIRSGLLMAGANQAWETGRPAQPDMEDGILTAYEISQMNLSNTELAVLSACETGLGDIEGNEGVYGLQRAFKIAGTHYLLMSLWQIPDLETQDLMTTFYRHWLTDKMPVPDAFQATQQEMRNKYKAPYWWAGFVLVE